MLFRSLVEKEQAYGPATEAATAAVVSEHRVVRESGLMLFRSLVDKGLVYDLATNAATVAVASENYDEHEYGLEVFASLVKAGHSEVYGPAATAATAAVVSGNCRVWSAGTALMEALQTRVR